MVRPVVLSWEGRCNRGAGFVRKGCRTSRTPNKRAPLRKCGNVVNGSISWPSWRGKGGVEPLPQILGPFAKSLVGKMQTLRYRHPRRRGWRRGINLNGGVERVQSSDPFPPFHSFTVRSQEALARYRASGEKAMPRTGPLWSLITRTCLLV